MLSPKDNKRITRVGPGTPGGALFRRYWLPACLSEELPEADGAPIRVRILGEDLVGFRDTNGTVALVDSFCPHRRAPMFFGRNEECGLRCVYHGWKFDKDGECVDMPSEPPDSLFKTKVRITAYPTHEAGGLVWTYMGPRDTMPAPPDYEFMRAPATHRFMGKHVQDCNYLQALEGALDSSHATILHNMDVGELEWLADYERTVPRMNVHPTDYGYMYTGIRHVNGKQWVRAYQYVMPATQFRGRVDGLLGGNVRYIGESQVPTINGHVWTPIDDFTTASYNFMYSYSPDQPLSIDGVMDQEVKDGRGKEDQLPDYRLKRNLANDYLIDRELQRTTTFTGIDGVNTQDIALQEGMGPIVDRSLEHLGTTDRAIIVMRQLMLEAVDAVERGEMPRGSDPSTYRNVRALDHMIPEGLEWQEALREEILAKFDLILAVAALGLFFITTAQSPAPALLPLTIATSPQAATAESYVALETGTFKKYGLDVQIEAAAKGAGSAVAGIVVSKAADIGEADIVALCAASEHGIPLTILAPSNVYFANSAPINVLAVGANSTVRSAKDVNGKVVAAPSLEGPAKISAAKWLDDHGADLSTIKFIEMPVVTMAAALQNGTLGAAMISEPALTMAGDTVRVLGRSYQDGYGKTFQLSYWFATPDWVKANPEAARRFALAMRETAEWTNDPKNAERYGQILQKYAHFSDDVIKKMGRANYGLVVDTRLAQPLIDAAIKYKSLHKACPAKDLVSPTALAAR